MQLAAYQDQIHLFEPWTNPAAPPSLEKVVELLSSDPQLKAQTFANPPRPGEERQWVQAMLTVRPPAENEPLFAAMDALLAEENAHRPTVDAATLPAAITLENGGQLALWQGDITTLKVDAITNAANAELLGCFRPFHACIDNVIHNIAGPRLREDCATIMQLQGHAERTSDAKITRGYNLPSRFVLHTVGPIIHQGAALTAGDEEALAQCYRSCLNLAAEAEVRSLAFCGISTGVFGFPRRRAAEIAVATVREWMVQNTAVQQVIFNTFDEEATAIYHHIVNGDKS